MNEHFTNQRDLNTSLANALNLIDSSIENHHQQAAYLTYMIGRAYPLDEHSLQLARMAALMHDIGFITMEDPGSVEELEADALNIAKIGSKLIEGFPDSSEVAVIVRYCQSSWDYFLSLGDEIQKEIYQSALIANIIHLADVVSTMVRKDDPILNQVKGICQTIRSLRGSEFAEDVVDAFLRAGENEYVWMDLRYNPQFLDYFVGEIAPVSLDETVRLTGIMSRIIDYRSSFTAMHSAGVAASALALAKFAGMNEEECKMIQIAGHLHDVGKLKVPKRILEKPGKLTDEEFNIVKEHPYYTRLNFLNIEGFEKIADWAGFHHEKLNGKGYPFHLGTEDLDTGSRIMAVADIFSAITEVRPYRKGMDKVAALSVLDDNVRSGGIDGDLVMLLKDNYEAINSAREDAARIEGARYYDSLNKMPE